MKAAILTAGCRLNQAESDALSAWLRTRDITVVREPAQADICYVNTCTVTAEADRSSRQLLRRVGRLASRPRVVALGCLAQRRPDLLRAIPGVSEVWSGPEKQAAIDGRIPAGRRSRALLKVQDGCDRGCRYCVVSRVRGAARSVAPDAVMAAVRSLAEEGYQEIVLTGLNLGSYRHGRAGLAQLLDQLLRLSGRYPGAQSVPFRLRVGSLEPDTVSDELAESLSAERVCPHFHLAVQSADDELLAAMGRPYEFSAVRRLVARLLEIRPDACIGADIISGLPGETAASFARTSARLAELPLAYIHAFTFSARSGTPACAMPGQVARVEARRRTADLRRLSVVLGRRYGQRFLGSVRPAVIESTRQVMTDNYLRVRLGQPAALPARQSCRVLLSGFEPSGAGVPAGVAGRITGRIVNDAEEP